jgi:DNA-binding XRE family transcriptional regulator
MELEKNENAQGANETEHEGKRPGESVKPPSDDHKEESRAGGHAQAAPTGRGAGGHGKGRARKNNLRKLRLERMMSKAELARRAGVSTLTIDRVERGMSCRMDTKRKILEALGLKPSDRVTVFGEDE